jgi:hypothetical protein
LRLSKTHTFHSIYLHNFLLSHHIEGTADGFVEGLDSR